MDGYGTNIRIGKLAFRCFEVHGRPSIAADISEGHRRGIYIYRFADGRYYAGKSEDVVERYVQHRHEYRHAEDCPVVEAMWFSEVPGEDGTELDGDETAVITALEARGLDLVNLMKTKTPGGVGDMEIGEAPFAGLRLPWNRSQRSRIGSVPADTEAFAPYESEGKKKRFDRLASKYYWPNLLPLLQRYVEESITAPDRTAGVLWTATAFPAVSKAKVPRILCLSSGNVKTLVLFEKRGIPCGFMNVREDKTRGAVLSQEITSSDVVRVDYGTARDIRRLYFDDLRQLSELLDDVGVLDCAYRLNVEMMRKGPTMYRRFSNPWLMCALLKAGER